jgi:hypothetical protein
MHREKPNDDPRQRTDKDSFSQSDKPWERQVRKNSNRVSCQKMTLSGGTRPIRTDCVARSQKSSLK